jgi:hypothetical protein
MIARREKVAIKSISAEESTSALPPGDGCGVPNVRRAGASRAHT